MFKKWRNALKNRIDIERIKQEKNENNNYHKKFSSIYPFKGKILEIIKENNVVLISRNTGCRKTTQTPKFIHESNAENGISITHLSRPQATPAAKRLSSEMNLELGSKIDFRVSMSQNYCKEARTSVKTTGIFMEELIISSFFEAGIPLLSVLLFPQTDFHFILLELILGKKY